MGEYPRAKGGGGLASGSGNQAVEVVPRQVRPGSQRPRGRVVVVERVGEDFQKARERIRRGAHAPIVPPRGRAGLIVIALLRGSGIRRGLFSCGGRGWDGPLGSQ